MLLGAGSCTVQPWAQPLLPGITVTQPTHGISQGAVGAHLSQHTLLHTPLNSQTPFLQPVVKATCQSQSLGTSASAMSQSKHLRGGATPVTRGKVVGIAARSDF